MASACICTCHALLAACYRHVCSAVLCKMIDAILQVSHGRRKEVPERPCVCTPVHIHFKGWCFGLFKYIGGCCEQRANMGSMVPQRTQWRR
jgi:hypothetical protein